MKDFKFKKIDAFATKQSDGNPAGYIWMDSHADISAFQMQQIAKELKGFVSEVVYVLQVSDKAFDLKYYSSEREVDFCGHGTIAVMYDLLTNNEALRKEKFLQINTNRGILRVENRIEREDAVFIMAPEPEEKVLLPSLQDIVLNLGLKTEDIDPSFPVEIINAGLSTLLIPIRTLKSIVTISPDLNGLKEFCFQAGVDIIEVFTINVVNPLNNYRTRVFSPTFGYIEDPATGSGNSALGYYLLKHEMWKTETVIIEQNGFYDRYNIVKLQKQKDENSNDRILFGGGAITRIEGKYFVY